jgi:hypothetical protein
MAMKANKRTFCMALFGATLLMTWVAFAAENRLNETLQEQSDTRQENDPAELFLKSIDLAIALKIL